MRGKVSSFAKRLPHGKENMLLRKHTVIVMILVLFMSKKMKFVKINIKGTQFGEDVRLRK